MAACGRPSGIPCRLARAAAMVELIDDMNAKGNVWFATLAEIARHVQDLIHGRPRSRKSPSGQSLCRR
jgi:hypothetical protein